MTQLTVHSTRLGIQSFSDVFHSDVPPLITILLRNQLFVRVLMCNLSFKKNIVYCSVRVLNTFGSRICARFSSFFEL